MAGPYQLCVPDPDLDAAAVARAHADPPIALWNPGPTDLDGAADWWRGRADWTDGGHASWMVKSAVGGDLLGSVSLHQVDGTTSWPRSGTGSCRRRVGAGSATAALSAATRFAFDALGLDRVEIFHAVENEGSHRLAERWGSGSRACTGRAFRYGDGVLRDEHSHARLAADPW